MAYSISRTRYFLLSILVLLIVTITASVLYGELWDQAVEELPKSQFRRQLRPQQCIYLSSRIY